jgi:two-component system, sensor histidine kinase and response regulator
MNTVWESERERLLKRIERERAARKQAEGLLEQKSMELYLANQQLREAAEGLEQVVAERTRDLHSALERAEEATRLKSAFLANMSHEIRTPMNAVIGLTHLVLQTPLNEQQHSYLTKAQQAARNLLGIINDILDFSKIEAGRMEIEQIPCDLHTIMQQQLVVNQHRAEEKGLRLRLEYPHDWHCGFLSDPLRIGQVLTNLIGNAIKFTSQGEVTITFGVVEQQGNRAQLRFSIIDQGIGISAAQQQRLFTPFTQADVATTRNYGGTGLGLAISKHLVELLGGTIGVRSALGEGSEFYFILPVELIDNNEEGAILRSESGSHTTTEMILGAKVLLVEDNKINRLVGIGMLRAIGIQVTTAESGEEALNLTASHPFDLILMDVQMPGMDGFETTRQMRQRGYKQPIIALTANSMQGDRERCLAAGMDDYLSKPIDPEALEAVLVRWIHLTRLNAEITPDDASDSRPIPAIAGINTAEGLKRLRGNHRLYREMLERFVNDYATLHNQWPHLTTQQQLPLLHNLKGVAATLGATALSREAQQLEAICHQRPLESHEGEALLSTLQSDLQHISAALEQNRPATAEKSVDTAADLASLLPTLRQFDDLLGKADLQVIEIMQQIRPILRQTPLASAADQVARHLDNFDFDAAQGVVKEWLTQLAKPAEPTHQSIGTS